MSTEPAPSPTPTPTPAPAATPPAATTPPASTTDAPASWQPYKPDTTKSAAENLVLKEAHDKTAPAGHDPNTPLGTPPEPKADDKPADSPAVTLTLDSIKPPEGMEIDPAFATEYIGLINKLQGNPAELAQELINLQGRLMTAAQEAGSKQWDDVQKDWKKLVETDPEIGGAKHSKTTADTNAILDRFGGPKTREALELTGFGNHPEFHRLLSKIAPFVLEAGPIPTPTPTPTKAGRTTDNLYPEQQKG
jgi:hypothetical protein